MGTLFKSTVAIDRVSHHKIITIEVIIIMMMIIIIIIINP
jgi:hypothetical protein